MNQTPVKELTKKYHHTKILEACKHLFAEKGYENVTSNDIAAYANYSKRTIYIYFSSKKDILQQLQQESLQKYSKSLGTAPLTCLEDFLQFTKSYLTAEAEDFYYIKRKCFSKTDEKDYFCFIEHFKPLINLLRDAYQCSVSSPDIPLLIWNSLLYAVEQNIPVGKLNRLLINGIVSV